MRLLAACSPLSFFLLAPDAADCCGDCAGAVLPYEAVTGDGRGHQVLSCAMRLRIWTTRMADDDDEDDDDGDQSAGSSRATPQNSLRITPGPRPRTV